VFIFLCSQSGDDSQEDLAKFGYKLISKVAIKKILVYLFLATSLEPCLTNLTVFLKILIEFRP
jgi:hypothetical protein